MNEGALQGELTGDAATEEAVMHLATDEQVKRVKHFRGTRELSTVAILIVEVLFFASYWRLSRAARTRSSTPRTPS